MSRFTQRTTKLPGLDRSADIQARLDGSTAVLSGKVATAQQADLLSRLAMLEPGVSSIRNELTVEPALLRAETLPSVPPTIPASP